MLRWYNWEQNTLFLHLGIQSRHNVEYSRPNFLVIWKNVMRKARQLTSSFNLIVLYFIILGCVLTNKWIILRNFIADASYLKRIPVCLPNVKKTNAGNIFYCLQKSPIIFYNIKEETLWTDYIYLINGQKKFIEIFWQGKYFLLFAKVAKSCKSAKNIL